MVHGLPVDTYPIGMFNVEVRRRGQITATIVTPEPGSYELHFSVPQHEQIGMRGVITIDDGDPVDPGSVATDVQDGNPPGSGVDLPVIDVVCSAVTRFGNALSGLAASV